MSTTAVAKIDFNKEQMAVIEKQFFPSGASQTEQQYCFSVARELGLNPITREIQFIPRRQKIGDKWVNKVEPMVGRDGFLSIAHRSGQLAGMQSIAVIREVPQLINGKWECRPDLVAECSVWRKDSDKQFTAQVAFREYCQKSADGTPTKFWAEKPETMLKKVAESQALRKAFNINGVYSPEELGAGFETSGGEIVQAIEAEFTRTEPDKGRLSVVPPPQPTPPSHPVSSNIDDEDSWPVGPAPVATDSQTQTGSDSVVSEIVSLLEGRQIPYEIDEECGIISAKSYNHKDLLKQSGFRWSADIKAWVFQFERDPF